VHLVAFAHVALPAASFVGGDAHRFLNPVVADLDVSFIMDGAGNLGFQLGNRLRGKSAHVDVGIVV